MGASINYKISPYPSFLKRGVNIIRFTILIIQINGRDETEDI